MLLLRQMKRIGPYVVLMFGALGLYMVANRILYTPIPGQIGPDAWPKIILCLLIIVCVAGIVQKLIIDPGAQFDAGQQSWIEAEQPDSEPVVESEDHPGIVMVVLAGTVAYLLLLETVGFFLCTLVYTAFVMWCGGLRRPLVIGGLALSIGVFFTFTFMKIVFVSLPIGSAPFSYVSLGVMKLLGIH